MRERPTEAAMNRRISRVNTLLRREISRVMANELRDPRLSAVVSVTHVDTAASLRHAKVYVSVLGDDGEKSDSLAALKSASGYIHRAVRDNVTLKTMPFLNFYLDDSIERGAQLSDMIDEALQEKGPGE